METMGLVIIICDMVSAFIRLVLQIVHESQSGLSSLRVLSSGSWSCSLCPTANGKILVAFRALILLNAFLIKVCGNGLVGPGIF